MHVCITATETNSFSLPPPLPLSHAGKSVGFKQSDLQALRRQRVQQLSHDMTKWGGVGVFERTADVTSINLPAQNPPLQGTLSFKLGFNGALRGGTGGSAASAAAANTASGAAGVTGAGLLASPRNGGGGPMRSRQNMVSSREGSAGEHGGVEPLGRLTAVRSIFLSRNLLSGALPGEAIARLRLLTILNLREVRSTAVVLK